MHRLVDDYFGALMISVAMVNFSSDYSFRVSDSSIYSFSFVCLFGARGIARHVRSEVQIVFQQEKSQLPVQLCDSFSEGRAIRYG
jgi:hypothetical protein